MENFLAITNALSDQSRLRALLALRGGELCVCQIIDLLGLAPSTVSKHLTILKQAGLVKSRKEERWIYYRLPEESERLTRPAIGSALEWVFRCLAADPTIAKDDTSLKKITHKNLSILCKLQRGKS